MERSTTTLFLLIAILMVAVTVPGCTSTKATGGGWFTDDRTEDHCSFGFNAQVKEARGAVNNEKAITGQFQFVDHTSGVKFHATISANNPELSENCARYFGVDQDGYTVEIYGCDWGNPNAIGTGDYIEITNSGLGTWSGQLQGGNIVAHVEE